MHRHTARCLTAVWLIFSLTWIVGCQPPPEAEGGPTPVEPAASTEASAVASSGSSSGVAAQPGAEVVATGVVSATVAAPAAAPTRPSNVAVAMYFMSDARDSTDCRLVVGEDKAVHFEGVTNPAMSCPDAFAWAALVTAVKDEFWRHWAADQHTWPQADWPSDDPVADATGPFPPCAAGDDSARCCAASRDDNPGYDDARYPAKHCPYFPDDHDDAASYVPPLLDARKPAVAQHSVFVDPASGSEVTEKGRLIRQSMSELVFRNRPMWHYVFENDLYNSEGLGAAYTAAQANLAQDAPYHRRYAGGTPTTIDFPVNSIMIKSNWMQEDRAKALGMVNDPEHPYITMDLRSPVTNNNAEIMAAGRHYLVAFHVSTKDIPEWTWATFEHVNNPGRCDFIGCNDSFGYLSPDTLSAGQDDNFTAPHTTSDNLLEGSTIFDPGGRYDGGEASPELAAVFEALGMGSEDESDEMPGALDRAWLSYRLKGSQVGFTDTMGRPTILGNSVTEGGFVASSSCMGCHARAAVNAAGKPILGVFEPRLSDIGYPQSSSGVPDPDWYISNSNSESFLNLIGLQTDFVWGILFANPLAKPGR